MVTLRLLLFQDPIYCAAIDRRIKAAMKEIKNVQDTTPMVRRVPALMPTNPSRPYQDSYQNSGPSRSGFAGGTQGLEPPQSFNLAAAQQSRMPQPSNIMEDSGWEMRPLQPQRADDESSVLPAQILISLENSSK
jgi:hypothetical protein